MLFRSRLLLKHGAKTVPAVVRGIEGRLDLDTLRHEPSSELALNDIGEVSVRVGTPLPVESYAHSRTGGAFLLIDPSDGYTLAAGMVQ